MPKKKFLLGIAHMHLYKLDRIFVIDENLRDNTPINYTAPQKKNILFIRPDLYTFMFLGSLNPNPGSV